MNGRPWPGRRSALPIAVQTSKPFV